MTQQLAESDVQGMRWMARNEAAQMLGVEPTQIDAWRLKVDHQFEGRRGRIVYLYMPEWLREMFASGRRAGAGNDEKKKIEIELMQIKRDKERGQLVRVEVVTEIFGRLATAINQCLEAAKRVDPDVVDRITKTMVKLENELNEQLAADLPRSSYRDAATTTSSAKPKAKRKGIRRKRNHTANGSVSGHAVSNK